MFERWVAVVPIFHLVLSAHKLRDVASQQCENIESEVGFLYVLLPIFQIKVAPAQAYAVYSACGRVLSQFVQVASQQLRQVCWQQIGQCSAAIYQCGGV